MEMEIKEKAKHITLKQKICRWQELVFFGTIAACACGGLLSYFNNSLLFFIILAAAPVILPVEYVKLWHTPKIEAVKALCIILIVEGIPLLCYTGYAVVPLALLYLIARKKGNGKIGVALCSLFIGLFMFMMTFVIG